MINQDEVVKVFYKYGVEFFCGVPDSYLNGFCTYLTENSPPGKHIIAANEGNAVALASGHYFMSGSVPLVYMQNSGMGNALNPLVSLVDKHVYHVPMVLLIGWRGAPTDNDHMQHKTQGEITLKLLDLLNIPYKIVEDDDSAIDETVGWAVKTAKGSRAPAALIAKKSVFAESSKKPPKDDSFPMSREDAIKVVLDNAPDDAIFVATTGRATRELYFLRDERGETHDNDVLNVGSMGHASSIVMGIALADKNRKVICLDGDSAAIMHMGALTTISKHGIPNIIHIILNNGAHESVGGQPSAGHRIDFEKVAQSCGYRAATVNTEGALVEALKRFSDGKIASFIDARIKQGMRPVLPPLNLDHDMIISGFMNKNTLKGAR